MTSPAVLPGAAVRVSRTVPGRRALQLALLVGGLLALGLLCGQRAQAAEGVPATPSPASVVTQKLPVPDVLTARRAPRLPEVPTVSAVPLVTVAPVVDSVHEIVRSVAETVTATVTGTVRQVTQLPVVQVPELPVGSEPPAGSAPAPVTPEPEPKPTPRPTHAGTPVAHDAGRERSRTETGAAATTAVSYGPRITAVPRTPGGAAQAGGHRAARPVDAPAHHAPPGDPDGALGKAAVDGTASRHADAHVVTFTDRAPLGLVPGAAVRLDAAGTRDRYRDVPVFPG
ncbi:hypothetical protein ACIRQQ_35815 [Streptomyces fuscichromogenes]|uniref:hypothetical protein n=1 Tax=Streptomyces fuscichromogenes TaxID=1324013 RepID=UPI003811CBDF